MRKLFLYESKAKNSGSKIIIFSKEFKKKFLLIGKESAKNDEPITKAQPVSSMQGTKVVFTAID
ncbi:MAG: hypothetical protein ACTHK0_05230 [Ginsengibacter sp.]